MAVALHLQGGPPLDPAAYGGASWGVLGALVFVILILGAIVYSVFVKGAAAQQSRDLMLMDFFKGQTAAAKDVADKNAAALGTISSAVTSSNAEMRVALERHGRMLEAVLVTWEGLQIAQGQKGGNGTRLTAAEIREIIRAAHEATRRGGS